MITDFNAQVMDYFAQHYDKPYLAVCAKLTGAKYFNAPWKQILGKLQRIQATVDSF